MIRLGRAVLVFFGIAGPRVARRVLLASDPDLPAIQKHLSRLSR